MPKVIVYAISSSKESLSACITALARRGSGCMPSQLQVRRATDRSHWGRGTTPGGASAAAGRASADHALIGCRGDFDRDLQGPGCAPCAPANPPRAAVLLVGLCFIFARPSRHRSRHSPPSPPPTLCRLAAWIGSKDARDWPHAGKPAATFATRIPSRTLGLHAAGGIATVSRASTRE